MKPSSEWSIGDYIVFLYLSFFVLIFISNPIGALIFIIVILVWLFKRDKKK